MPLHLNSAVVSGCVPPSYRTGVQFSFSRQLCCTGELKIKEDNDEFSRKYAFFFFLVKLPAFLKRDVAERRLPWDLTPKVLSYVRFGQKMFVGSS